VVAAGGLLPPVTASVMPTAAAMTTTTPPPIAAQSRRFRRLASSARCLAIRCRAFSLFLPVLLALDTPAPYPSRSSPDNPRAG
jgi:hypothetical protein